jgi:DNA-binding CsgD family transcriptional regulator
MKTTQKKAKHNTLNDFGKIPPQAIDLEQTILGAALIEAKTLAKVMDILKPEMFYKTEHQIIFAAMQKLYANEHPVDILTLNQILTKAKKIANAGGTVYLLSLTDKVSGSANIEFHARIIYQKYIQREIIRISSQGITPGLDETSDPLDILSTQNNEISHLIEQLNPTEEKTKQNTIPFPLEVLPKFIQHFISEVNTSEKFSIDFMGVAFMAAYAGLAGNNLQLRYSPTWITAPIFWFIVVGAPGSKKSHPVKLMLKPLKRIDESRRQHYEEEKQEFDKFYEMDKSERAGMEAPIKPTDQQIIIKNTTTEALFYAHKNNPKGLLYYRDEIEAWVRSMDQYKGGKGDDMANWLSLFDGDDLNINRVTKERLVLDNTNVNLIGTTQPARISNIPSDNGLIHRLLFTSADSNISNLTFETNVDDNMLNKYELMMNQVFEYYKDMETPKVYTMTPEAKEVSQQIDSYLVATQKDSSTQPIIKEYCEKLKTYIPRFELLLADSEAMFNPEVWGAQITQKAAADTFKLIKYFLNNAINLFQDQGKMQEAKNIGKSYNLKTTEAKAIEMLNNGVKISQIAGELNVSRNMIYKYKKKAKLKV